MSFTANRIIRKKRDGQNLSFRELNEFFKHFLSGNLPDYQMSALLMAIYFTGLNEQETLDLTKIFIESGITADLSKIELPKIDKHSTGGVGDKTSIILAPLIACFDIVVPMMSGRGLGHTGGTLDKLESIPGFKIHLSLDEFYSNLKKINVCMIGQTDELTPADKKIYALRDVTATVENLGLITSSIVSKKIAEGADGIVYDVKCGSGSTLSGYHKAKELAANLIKVTEKFGKKSSAVLTSMDEPLGNSIGNWLEIQECIDIMKCEATENSKDLIELTLYLGGVMLMLAEKCKTIEAGISMCKQKIENREAYNKFLELVKLQGGEIKYISGENIYPNTSNKIEIYASESGFITTLDAYNFGAASIELGCGRPHKESEIDYSAGIIIKKKSGEKVGEGETICTIFSNNNESLIPAKKLILEGIEIKENYKSPQSRILEYLD